MPIKHEKRVLLIDIQVFLFSLPILGKFLIWSSLLPTACHPVLRGVQRSFPVCCRSNSGVWWSDVSATLTESRPQRGILGSRSLAVTASGHRPHPGGISLSRRGPVTRAVVRVQAFQLVLSARRVLPKTAGAGSFRGERCSSSSRGPRHLNKYCVGILSTPKTLAMLTIVTRG